MNFENENFMINPHFKFKEIISDKAEGYSVSSLFDIFIDNESELLLAFPYFDIKNPYSKDFNISLVRLKDNKEKTKLEGHIARLKVIKYFYDKYTNKKYIVSSDRKNKVIIWDINNGYNKLFENIFDDYDNCINDILMLFINNQIYLVITSLSVNGATKIINLNFSKETKINSTIEISESQGFTKFSLSYWHNEKYNNYYIIQTGKNKVLINEYQNKEKYAEINTSNEYRNNISSLVYTKNNSNFLLICSNFGLIIIYDLLNKIIFEEIKIENAYLINVIKWNENYFVTIDANKKSIILIDMNCYKIINVVKIKEIFGHERFLRKVRHPIYGEALISIGNDYKIKLYIDKNIEKNIKLFL